MANPDQPPAPPPRGLISRFAKIEPGEGFAVLAAFFLYFCILGGYFAVRPVRETIGTLLGAQRVSNLFVVTWIVTLALVPVYGFLCSHFRRQTFLPWIYGGVALALATCGATFLQNEGNVTVGAFFYVLISVFNLLLVSVLWSFLLELFDPNQVKRLFGIIAAGGTSGALAGPLLTDLLVKHIGNAGILFLGAAMFVIAVFLQQLLLWIWARTDHAPAPAAPAPAASLAQPQNTTFEYKSPQTTLPVPRDRPIGGNPFAGFTRVIKSPYLLGISLFVILLATVNTFLYFQQLDLVAATFKSSADRTRVFARLDYIVQTLTILSQLFLTGRAASRFGIALLLVLVPIAMVGGFLMLAIVHTFPMLAVVMVARRAGEYAFVRPGREMLFSHVDLETKYKAKNFIDVPVYRGGDALAAKISDGLKTAGLTPQNVAYLGALIALVWAINGLWLGRRREHTTQPPVPTPAADSNAVPTSKQHVP